ncbi:SH3 domain-containing protein [Sphingomonas jaspsi]|uniref:SH3 domain-containing protein n=1 Tax=Sphingomonas jaspsi TaxID=392409 RepID=UPI0004B6EE21|nr:SH3 domain-containing protein [Sphingomonas jaspsi]
MRGLIAASLIVVAATAAAQDRPVPYWASIASGEAMTRTGPGRNYPGVWLYKRRDLPVRVLQRHENWRKIEDMEGAQGWMLVTLLSDRRTAVIKDGDPRNVRVRPNSGAPIRYRVEAGAVGRIDHCDGDWCHIQFGAREGYVAQGEIWGTSDGETVE